MDIHRQKVLFLSVMLHLYNLGSTASPMAAKSTNTSTQTAISSQRKKVTYFFTEEPMDMGEKDGKIQCPRTCRCENTFTNYLTIRDCSADIFQDLTELMINNPDIGWLEIDNAKNLSRIPCAVGNVTHLVSLSVTNTNISDVPWNCLRKLPELQGLTLSHNLIKVVKNGSFYDFPYLNALDLSYNQITDIEQDVFADANRLAPLTQISLNHNLITALDTWPLKIPRRGFSGFLLDLSYNPIARFKATTAIDPLTDCEHSNALRLILNNCTIHHLSDILSGWGMDIYKSDLIERCFNEVVIQMWHNPMVCDCQDFAVYKHLKDFFNPVFIGLTCVKPLSLRGQNPLHVDLQKFTCAITDQCPIECQCTYLPFYGHINVTCQEVAGGSLPKTLPSPIDGSTYNLHLTHSQVDIIEYRRYLEHTRVAIFSHNSIRSIDARALRALGNVVVLHIDSNQLETLLIGSEISSFHALTEVYLGNNPYRCDCQLRPLKHWLQTNSDKVKDVNIITCTSPEKLANRHVIAVDDQDLCPSLTLTISLCVSAGIVVFIALVLLLLISSRKIRVWVFKKTNWHPLDKNEFVGEGKEFDMFVSYATEDEDYVGEYLIPELERLGFKVCFHRVHFLGGKSLIDNITECIDKSKRMLAFLSASYKDSGICMYEYELVMELDLLEGTSRLVTIKADDLDMDELDLRVRTYLKTATYIMQESVNFWDNLLYSLPVDRLGAAE